MGVKYCLCRRYDRGRCALILEDIVLLPDDERMLEP